MKRIAKKINENLKKKVNEDNFDDPRVGRRVELVFTSDPYTNLEQGDQGTIQFVDDRGTLFVKWDEGSNLGLITGEDEWKYVD